MVPAHERLSSGLVFYYNHLDIVVARKFLYVRISLEEDIVDRKAGNETIRWNDRDGWIHIDGVVRRGFLL